MIYNIWTFYQSLIALFVCACLFTCLFVSYLIAYYCIDLFSCYFYCCCSIPYSSLGPTTQDSIQPGLAELGHAFETNPISIWSQHSDLMIRYLTCCLCLRESPTGLLRILTVYLDLCTALKQEGTIQLHEAEITCILPHLMDKAGRFKLNI